MDKRILIALAALAGICAAILLFPSRDKVDADVAVGHDHAPDRGEVETPEPKRTKKRRMNDVSETPVPNAKETARAANEARKATPFYQHTQAVAKRWLVMANTIGPAGQTELASEMRELSRELRSASRPDGAEADQQAALEHEGELLAKAQAVQLDAEMAEILEYLTEAYQAATTGALPPEAQPTTMEYEPTADDQGDGTQDEPADQPEPNDQ
jgi:hypothetical protein